MSEDIIKSIKCAIYTRKSTDEGLEKEFNTLEAQREAGLNYVKSQVHQGWEALSEHYDDGGYSGGNMNRPALKRLFEDIKAGKVDMIVVYKIDRLTRSLTDFSKMMELFDEYKVSFVSVTQNFNTYDSMGRLTLNVLLSFAQFEREVSGERIRDKISASKKKGMWMGGPLPLGYDLKDKKLVVNPDEAEVVRLMFEKYLVCKSPQYLADWLNNSGYRTKMKITKSGKTIGGKPFDRAHLYRILDNRLYLGKIYYKGELYDGQHEAIISQNLWDKVHKLKDKPFAEKASINKTFEFKTLKGLLFCGCCGYAMVPTKAVKRGREYYYYTSLKAIKKSYRFCEVKSVPALALENYVINKLKDLLTDPLVVHSLSNEVTKRLPDKSEYDVIKVVQGNKFINALGAETRQQLFNMAISRITIWPDKIRIQLKPWLNELVQKSLLDDKIWIYNPDTTAYETTENITFLKRRQQTEIYVGDEAEERHQDKQMIVALVRAFGWQHKLERGNLNIQELAQLEQMDRSYMGKIIRLTCLAPDIVESILAGLQPRDLTLKDLIRNTIPVDWNEQRKMFGFRQD